MSILSSAGEKAGVDAARIGADAIEHVGDKVGDVAKNLEEGLADGVSVTADAINRLNRTIADESAAWRTVAARFADFLDRISILPPKS